MALHNRPVPQRTLSLVAALLAVGPWGCGGPEPELMGRTLGEWNARIGAEERLDRLAAVRAMGEIARRDRQRNPGAPGAVDALLRASSHDDSAVRYWAVRSLGDVTDPGAAAVERLQSALGDTAGEVRTWAAYGLCRHGNTEAGLPVLIDGLRSENGGVRLQAAHALESLGESSALVVEALKGVLGDQFGYPDRVATRILENLGELPPG